MSREHNFRQLRWGHNLACVELAKVKRWTLNKYGLPTRAARIIATGTCWTLNPVRVGDTFVWLGGDDVEVVAEITRVRSASTVSDMSFWEGVITSHRADQVA